VYFLQKRPFSSERAPIELKRKNTMCVLLLCRRWFWLAVCLVSATAILLLFARHGHRPKHTGHHMFLSSGEYIVAHSSDVTDEDEDHAWGLETIPRRASLAAASDDVMKRLMPNETFRGENIDVETCRTEESRIALKQSTRTALLDPMGRHASSVRQWPAKSLVAPPRLTARFDEEHVRVILALDVPFIAADAMFFASMRPFDAVNWRTATSQWHVPTDQCQNTRAAAGEPNETTAMWAHPPNALYKSALHDTQFSSYAPLNSAVWRFSSATEVKPACDRVRLVANMSFAELQSCDTTNGGSPVTIEATTFGANIAGTLWLTLLWPSGDDATAAAEDDEIDHVAWPLAFSLSVDPQEAKISISNSPRQPLVSTVHSEDVSTPLAQRVAKNQNIVERVQSDPQALFIPQWEHQTRLVDIWFDKAGDAAHGITYAAVVSRTGRYMRMQIETTSRLTNRDALAAMVPFAESNAERFWGIVHSHAPQFEARSIRRGRDAPIDTFGHFRVGEVSAAEGDQKCFLGVCSHKRILALEPETAQLYEDTFDVLLYDSSSTAHAQSEPDLVVHIDVAVSDPVFDASAASMHKLGSIQLETTQHISTSDSPIIHEHPFLGGSDRVCMQTFAIGPKSLIDSIELHTLRAWLCVDDSSSSQQADSIEAPKRERTPGEQSELKQGTGCTGQRHYIALHTDHLLNEMAQRVYQPEVREPGVYGARSTAVCFNTTTAFIDYNGNSVYRENQYFQCEVHVSPAQWRRRSIADKHQREATARRGCFAALSRLLQPADDGQQQQQPPQAAATSARPASGSSLTSALKKLDVEGRIERFHTTRFTVSPGETMREKRLAGVSEPTSFLAIVIIIVVAAFLCVCLCLVRSQTALCDQKDDPITDVHQYQ